jgi:hypothetical protein
MQPRVQLLIFLPAIVLVAGLLLGSGNVGAVLARAGGPARVSGPFLTNWHGAGPGLAVALASAKAARGEQASAGGAQPASAPADAARPYQVDTAPTITVERIEAVLRDFSSPAAGTGQAFYDLGVQYGINPAVALAFFIHESACGTKGVARFTKSIGNIRVTPGYRDYEGYRAYDTWEQGIEDYYKLIRELYIDGWGLRTVAQILPRYAPPADNNDTDAYIHNVEQLMDSWR